MTDQDILFEQKGALGLITLNRPKALNALTHAMCIALYDQLLAWAKDDSIGAVLIKGEGEKAFCAGGDVVALYNSGKAYRDGDKSNIEWRSFFRDEYRMNAAINDFPKPYIALMHGFTMGGGVGVSVHGTHRVASEGTKLSMPETGLGLIPDVGGGYFMPRLPGEMGMYLALTGQRVKAADCMDLGICGHYIESTKHQELITALAIETKLNTKRVDAILNQFSTPPEKGEIMNHKTQIDALFSGDSLEDILTRLKADRSEWAEGALKTLLKMSPTSLHLTFAQMRNGGKLSLHEDLQMEFRLVNHIMMGHDFYEGVRALLLDKDMSPQWSPNKIAAVEPEAIEQYFDNLGVLELRF